MYTLYGGGYSRGHMIEMVLVELKQPYTLIKVDTQKGEHLSRDYLRINPAGWVPALITPKGQVLYETQAINLYLADRHQAGVLSPIGGDPDRGLFLSGLFYLAGELEPAMKRYFYPHRYGLRQGDAADIRQKSLAEVCKMLGVIEGRLAKRGPYHLGPRYSLVDLVLGYWINSIMDHDAITGFVAINHCLTHVTARPKLATLFDDLRQRTAEYAAIDNLPDFAG